VTPQELSDAIVGALTRLESRGDLALPGGVPSTVTVERPKIRAQGDYASNVALQLAKPTGLPPRELAARLVAELAGSAGIADLSVAGPGFLNFAVDGAAQGSVAASIVQAGPAYGHSDRLAGLRVNVEFVSANPTGPLHLGHTRWAVLGDALARVLSAAGAAVTSEFYVNDRGAQMDKFGASLEAVALGRPVPEDGYRGDYVGDVAADIVAADPSLLDLPEPERLVAFREAGYARQLDEQREQLEAFGTHFDVWFSERSLFDEGKVEHGLDVLAEQGHLYEADGALWMRTTDFGDDKDRVLRRSNGELTYFASDTAYYLDKRERGADLCVYLLGADHHGYVGRLRAMAACAGDDPDQHLEVLIGQLVKVMQGDQEVRLSKRAGSLVTLAELVDLIGVDAPRYSLARYPADTPLVLDVEQITRASADNPVYYVQYAHSRTVQLLGNGAAFGVVPDPHDVDAALIGGPREGELLRTLADFPRVVEAAASLREPHRVARHLEEVAATFHSFYAACRVLPVGDEPVQPVHHARLLLVDATRVVLANGLALLGVQAPDRM